MTTEPANRGPRSHGVQDNALAKALPGLHRWARKNPANSARVTAIIAEMTAHADQAWPPTSSLRARLAAFIADPPAYDATGAPIDGDVRDKAWFAWIDVTWWAHLASMTPAQDSRARADHTLEFAWDIDGIAWDLDGDLVGTLDQSKARRIDHVGIGTYDGSVLCSAWIAPVELGGQRDAIAVYEHLRETGTPIDAATRAALDATGAPGVPPHARDHQHRGVTR